jgi:SAM-dependent methyltransferase
VSASIGKRLLRRAAFVVESLISGWRLPERVLLGLLGQYYASRFRRQWQWSVEPPHFFDHRIGIFDFAFGSSKMGSYPYSRGFFSSEVIREGDVLLDIGCGDGFFTRRFFAPRCAQVDAIDVEPSAIEAASAINSAPNIAYHLLDATALPFPRPCYDVIVWDGALGHFAPATTARMLEKIGAALGDSGIFVGSESLGREGSDHLQFFETLEDLYALLAPRFQCVQLRAIDYKLGAGFLRREAFWRCSNDERRLRESQWRTT